MKNKEVIRCFSFLLLFLFVISFTYAQGCADEGWKGNGKIHENKTIIITCPSCDYINFTATNTSQNIFLSDVQMNKSGSTFSYTFLGEDLNSVGNYQLDGYSDLDIPLSVCFDVTMTGEDTSLGTYVILIILSVSLFLSVVWINFKFDRKRADQLYNKIVVGYFQHNLGQDKGNLGNTVLYTIAYGLLRNLLMFYYLAIVFFMFIITELVEAFAIDSMIVLFTTILNVSLWGFIAVFIVMIFGFYEIIMSLMRDVQDSFRGLYNGK